MICKKLGAIIKPALCIGRQLATIDNRPKYEACLDCEQGKALIAKDPDEARRMKEANRKRPPNRSISGKITPARNIFL